MATHHKDVHAAMAALNSLPAAVDEIGFTRDRSLLNNLIEEATQALDTLKEHHEEQSPSVAAGALAANGHGH